MLAGCRQLFGLDDPVGVGIHDGATGDGVDGAPTDGMVGCGATRTFTADGTFTLPSGCTSFTVEAKGGGGAGGARNAGTAAGAGGDGGFATKQFTGQPAGTTYTITIGAGGACGSTTATAGGYAGGRGGSATNSGGAGGGTAAPPGGTGGP
ncbi:MAG: hypothetical protein H6Q90_6398, partial [Deltaproteobacteria bacterium]|nr:hypothetical protein [Deltaproteobacteria bacterium]